MSEVTIKRVQPSGWLWIQHGELMDQCTIPELAEWLGVTKQTVRRWCRGDPIPQATQIALKYRLGEIEGLPGFHVDQDGCLWSPTGNRGFTGAEIENWGHVYRQRDVLERELLELRRRVEALQQGTDVVPFPWRPAHASSSETSRSSNRTRFSSDSTRSWARVRP